MLSLHWLYSQYAALFKQASGYSPARNIRFYTDMGKTPLNIKQ